VLKTIADLMQERNNLSTYKIVKFHKSSGRAGGFLRKTNHA
jgi:hypothetical protein